MTNNLIKDAILKFVEKKYKNVYTNYDIRIIVDFCFDHLIGLDKIYTKDSIRKKIKSDSNEEFFNISLGYIIEIGVPLLITKHLSKNNYKKEDVNLIVEIFDFAIYLYLSFEFNFETFEQHYFSKATINELTYRAFAHLNNSKQENPNEYLLGLYCSYLLSLITDYPLKWIKFSLTANNKFIINQQIEFGSFKFESNSYEIYSGGTIKQKKTCRVIIICEAKESNNIIENKIHFESNDKSLLNSLCFFGNYQFAIMNQDRIMLCRIPKKNSTNLNDTGITMLRTQLAMAGYGNNIPESKRPFKLEDNEPHVCSILFDQSGIKEIYFSISFPEPRQIKLYK